MLEEKEVGEREGGREGGGVITSRTSGRDYFCKEIRRATRLSSPKHDIIIITMSASIPSSIVRETLVPVSPRPTDDQKKPRTHPSLHSTNNVHIVHNVHSSNNVHCTLCTRPRI